MLLFLISLFCFRVQTSYVSVEPKRKRQIPSPPPGSSSLPNPSQAVAVSESADGSSQVDPSSQSPLVPRQTPNRELRRARIIITVKRTENYKRWLEENPLQAIIAADGDDEDDDEHSVHATEAAPQLL
jgi:hypothetical protein